MKKEIKLLYIEFINYNKQKNDILINNEAQILKNIESKISKKLVESKTRLALLYLFFSFIGYLLSLKFCPHWFVKMDQLLYNSLSFLKTSCNCAAYSIICGAVFTGVPFLLSLLFLNPFKRRFLLLKMSGLVIPLPLVTTVLPILFQNYFHFKGKMLIQNNIINPYLWSISAIITPYVLYFLSYILSRQKIKHK